MSEIYFDQTRTPINQIFEKSLRLDYIRRNALLEPTIQVNPNAIPILIPERTKRTVNDANMKFTCLYGYVNAFGKIYTTDSYVTCRTMSTITDIETKIDCAEGARICAIRLKNRPDKASTPMTFESDVYGDAWLFFSNKGNGSTGTISYQPVSYNVKYYNYDVRCDTYEIKNQSITETSTGRPTYAGGSTNTSNTFSYYTTASAFSGQNMGLSADDISKVQEFIGKVITDNTDHRCYIDNLTNFTNYHYAYGFPVADYMSQSIFKVAIPTEFPDFIPVFDARDTDDDSWIDNAYNYLINGVRNGDSNPFDTSKERHIIEDYETDFTLYITPYSSGGTHFSLTATNTEFTNNRADIANDYCMMVATGRRELTASRTPQGQQTLTKSWHETVVEHTDEYTNNDYEIQCIFTKSLPTSEWLPTLQHHSGTFRVNLDYSATADCGVKIANVKWGDVWNLTETCNRSSITDGYIYTASSGETMKVLFRSITVDDLKDINDDGYDNESDKEEENAGATASEVCGHGLGTYKVSQAGFDAINDALWSTDWTQLFKSNTIDPVKCVISCKGIPFAHSGTVTDTVYIANQAIECSAGKCNPVETYNIGNYIIQAVNNNFTDMTMTKVRVYLPYIAWVELPAEEVISRVGRAEVGLQSVTKRLNFKYIVDFVDGSCRCVISVNGTERWFFDGNCGIDIPVTSDNHTSAINNAIKSGLQSFMSVGLAVGSAYAGNAMGVASGATSAISSLANTIPTYNYSATANSSGYINHSMGNKLVIVIESPNIQMPNGYGHKYGFPCMRNLTLGGLSGYTKCDNVDLTGINGTNYELNYIKSALESGVYL